MAAAPISQGSRVHSSGPCWGHGHPTRVEEERSERPSIARLLEEDGILQADVCCSLCSKLGGAAAVTRVRDSLILVSGAVQGGSRRNGPGEGEVEGSTRSGAEVARRGKRERTREHTQAASGEARRAKKGRPNTRKVRSQFLLSQATAPPLSTMDAISGQSTTKTLCC